MEKYCWIGCIYVATTSNYDFTESYSDGVTKSSHKLTLKDPGIYSLELRGDSNYRINLTLPSGEIITGGQARYRESNMSYTTQNWYPKNFTILFKSSSSNGTITLARNTTYGNYVDLQYSVILRKLS